MHTSSLLELVKNIENKSFELKYYFWTTNNGDVFLIKNREDNQSLWSYTKTRKWRPLHNADAFDEYPNENAHFESIKYENGNIVFSKLIDKNMPLEILKINQTLENQTYKVGYYFWKTENNIYYLFKENNDTSKSIWHYTTERKWQPIHNADAFDGFNKADKTIQNIIFNKTLAFLSLGDIQNQSNINLKNTNIDDIRQEPYYKYSWHQMPISQLNGIPIDKNSHMNIEKAWEITRGENVSIAIIDTDFVVDHPDLSDNLKSSFNVITNDSYVHPISDGDSHGTSVAGIIGASVNNIGIVGGAPKSKMILINFPLKGPISNLIKAFDYAQKNGAKIINCSWGSGYVSDALRVKIEELYNENIIIVFATGNNNANTDYINYGAESKMQTVLGVGASDEYNNRAEYSNYGSEIDFVAPGGIYGVLTTDALGEKGVNKTEKLVDKDYSFRSGTSFAAPNASSIIALMASVYPNITPNEAREIIIKTADKIVGGYNSDGFNIELGYGKINAYEAVKKAMEMKKQQ